MITMRKQAKILLGKALRIHDKQFRQRFNRFVKRGASCHIWTGYTDKDGYGRFWLDGRSRLAHRVSYAASGRKLNSGKDVHHKCHNRSCVNEKHLRKIDAVTHRNRASKIDETDIPF